MLLILLLLAVLVPGIATGQTRPVADHHQHLFSPATVQLVSPPAPQPVILPPALDSLVQARSTGTGDSSVLASLYTADAWLAPSGARWVRGGNTVIGWVRSDAPNARLVPVGWEATDSSGFVTAYSISPQPDSSRFMQQVLLSLRKGADGRWRIAAESRAPVGPAVNPIAAKDLVALLDAGGIGRAVVLSMAYTWGNPNRAVPNEYERVKEENDWTARQVALYPDRLRGFCSINPLRPYALAEMERCAASPGRRSGLKLHFGNSVVDVHNAEHIAQVRRVFRLANDQRMPIIIHLRASISRGLPYGAAEARIFLDSLMPSVPDVPVQIAHLAGSGGYGDRPAEAALEFLANAVATRHPGTRNLYFDVSGVVGGSLGIPPATARTIAVRIRQIGVDRIFYGSDAATGGNLAPREAWAAFRQLPLTDAEFQAIANNVAPYLK